MLFQGSNQHGVVGKQEVYFQREQGQSMALTLLNRVVKRPHLSLLQFSHLENGIKLLILKNNCDLENFYKEPDIVCCLVYPQYATRLVYFLFPMI